MSKATSRRLFLTAILLWIVGGVLIYLGANGTQSGAGPSTLTTIGAVVAGIGGILNLVAWIGALIRTAVLGRWGWFLALLVLGLLGLVVIVMLVYVLGGPDERALFDHMAEMVKRLLRAKPWEGVEKLPIGFELHRPKPLPEDDDPALLEAP